MMKNVLAAGVLVLLLGSAVWAEFAAFDSGQTVQSILGRKLENEHVKNAHIYADGTFDGIYNGISYAGDWSLEDGKFCREIKRGLDSARACLTLVPVFGEAGEIIAVDFLSSGSATRFHLR
ncbi:hypothetical protein K3X13_08160 [Aliiroseovarius crassostreae]|uniref:Dihydrodipicolinate reductase n=1 Tax=Aliiroseovarius crassostreae TaxID=154981 RepID=A0A9Q9LY58_9RHOB|nr:hypothetical protein [Aliiroseovarius crassostreae]UWP87925.1 hypothetical protein K3J57_08220 [Aliiroseovarius crassostreae]UWP91077.1 hypothetical protein K3X13_08160 [Aliiroseovarius crassostreae]UWP94264.1 hypothetical protein K3X48_08335 [Aliiroseovarius crassostreae]UWP97388.1 hypothetical protein K3X53_08160 [Aliiroseovarius crassostreae]UWQ00544.1 hypothetical protein K3X44_08285 [Aliiroseovarius crassostreae]